MNRGLVLLSFIVIQLITIKAQTYSGKIIDNITHKAIDNASVSLTGANKNIISYTYANEDGIFSLNSPEGATAVYLSVYSLGYEPIEVSISDYKSGNTINLISKTFKLKEVKIKADRIIEQQDTLVYSVSGFRQVQDRSIADVIAKMPGLEIGANGSIRFQGRAINKFYIEGMDLLGGKYAQASKNLSADKVLSVQVLQNHQPVKALRDVEFNEQAGLNIILKDNAKGSWNGVIDIGKGVQMQESHDFLYDNRLSAMMFSKNIQSVSLYKNNNSGKDIEHEVRNLTDEATSSLNEKNSLFDKISLLSSGLDQKRSRFNTTHLFATNWLFRTLKAHTLRIQMDGVIDNTTANQSISTLYYDINEKYNELFEVKERRNQWQSKISYEINEKELYLNNTLKGYINFDHTRGNTRLNDQWVSQNIVPQKRRLSNELQFIRNYGNNKSLSIYSNVDYNYLPGELLLLENFNEKLNVELMDFHTYTYFRHRIGWFQAIYKAGIKVKNQNMEVMYADLNSSNKYSENNIYIEPSLKMNRGKFKLDIFVPLGYYNLSLNSDKKNRLIFTPNIKVGYEMNGTTNLWLNYLSTVNFPSIDRLCNVPYYVNYRTQIINGGNITEIKQNTASLSFRISQPIKGYFFNITAFYSGLYDELYESYLNNNIYIRKSTGIKTDSYSYGLSGRVSQSLGWSKAVLGINGRYSCNEYKMIFDNELTPFQLQSMQIGVNYSLRPLPIFSLEGNSNYIVSRRHNKNVGENRGNTLKSFHHICKLFILPADRWQIALENDIYHSNDKSVSLNYFSDLSVSYKRRRYEIGLYCNNLWGNSIFERKTYTTSYEIFRILDIRPREIMGKIIIEF
ncbi:MAG: carboxypeptidase-like regulatory domain-containing protein [Phocaeicola sp.]